MVKRYVVRRRGSEVFYRSILGGDIKKCWLITWMDWGRSADLGDQMNDPLPVPAAVRTRTRKRVSTDTP